MNTNHIFCRARAIEARRDADSANLDNVRDRHLRAAEAWEVMAERGERTVRRRAEAEARSADARAEAEFGATSIPI